MPVRRFTDPLYVQYVWDSIKAVAQSKHVLDVGRLVRSIQRLADCSQVQAELYVKQTLDDGLILAVRKPTPKVGMVHEIESYKINKQEELQTPFDDGHDWYCIECHLAGDVNLCRKCHRVFHAECSKKAGQSRTLFPKAVVPIVAVEAAPAKSPPSEPRTPDMETSANTSLSSESNEKPPDLNTTDTTDITEKSVSEENTPEEASKSEIPVISISKPMEDTPDEATAYDESLCCICNWNECDPGTGLDIEEFNYLLNFILLRIKSWVPEHLTTNINALPKYEWHTPYEMSWRAGQLFYLHMDMAAVELKIRTKDYSNFSQFQGDVITMLHNIAIFHGVASQEYGAAELMIKDMEYDIGELQNCVDCYRHSNEKINEKWFCLPCRIPHLLVFAKQSGYPYWPAKVMKEAGANVDVRFFGGKYERALLTKNCIKPITTSMSQLHVKKTAGFNRAMDELRFHQRLLQNPSEVERIKAIVSDRPKLTKKSKTPKKVINMSRSLNISARSSISKRSNVRSASMSDDVYEFHDSPTEMNRKDKDASVKRKLSSPEIGPENKVKKLSSPESPKQMDVPTEVPKASPEKPPEPDVIHLSDADEEKDGFMEFNDPSQNLVSSSTELLRDEENGMQKLDQQYCDAVERMRRELEQRKTSKQIVVLAMDAMQAEIDRLQNEHNETLKRLFDAHNTQISETKKKQWCFNCEQDAIYHCCWNTAYCSPTCQQQHWQAEHKKVCRRKR